MNDINNVDEFTNDEKNYIINLSKNVKSRTNKEVFNQLKEILYNKVSASNLSRDDDPPEFIDNPVAIEGKGFRKKRKIIFGKGITPTTTINKSNQDNFTLDTNKNIYIELSKLKKNNILSVKYKSTHNNHPKFTQQRVSQSLSDIIQDIINNKLDERLLKTLNPDEKTILDHFLRIFKIKDIVIDKKELENFNNQFDILMGEISSGNNNPEVKQQLKQFVYRAIKLGRLKKSEGIELLLQI